MSKGRQMLQCIGSRYSQLKGVAAATAFAFKSWAAKNGRYVFYGTSILAYNVWMICPQEFQKQVFFTSIALCFVVASITFLICYGGVADKIFFALAANNLIEELGFGDPTKLTINEYLSAIVVAAIVAFTFYKSDKWKTSRTA